MQKNKTEKQIRAAIIIQKNWKRHVARKKFIKLLKRQKKKMFAAREILQSERKYCENISFVINKVMIPSKEFINNNQTIKNLFGNIEQIFNLHNHFLKCLEKTMQDFDPHKTKISFTLMKELFNKQQFKSAYTEYCFGYKIIDKTIKNVMTTNKNMAQLLNTLGVSATNLTLESFMIKPVQRLCKYSLLIDEYLKNMENDHIDYKMIEETTVLVQKMVQQTNDSVQQFLMSERFQELCTTFTSFFNKIHSPKKLRMFYQTKEVTILDLIKEQEVKYQSMALFQNTVIFLPQIGKEPTFSNFLFCRQLVNHKYYKNIVQLVDGDRYTYVQFSFQKDKKEFMRVLQYKLNQSKKEQFEQYIKVNILGTENRESFFSSYTVYIILIDDHGKTSTIYPRFKDLLKVQEMVIDRGLPLNPPLLAKQSIIATLKSKTIEKRKLTIQEFLERVFNTCPVADIKEAEQILKVYQNNGQGLSVRMSPEVQQISVMLPNMQKVKVMINVHDSKIKDLKLLISQQMGMENSNQFQLFQIRNKNYAAKKILYEEQPVKKIYDEQKESSTSFNPFRDTLDYLYTRYYYLSQSVEEELYKCDQARAELELSVIHWEVYNYKLQEEVMLTFMCLFAIYIHLPLQNSEKLTFFIKELTKKNYKVSEEQFRVYFSQVKKMVNGQDNLPQSLPLLIIKVVSNSFIYQTQQFEVEVHHKIYSSIKKMYPSLQQKIYLGFHPELVYILSLKDKSVIAKFSYSQLSLESHTNAVVFELPHTQIPLTLKTSQPFQIRKLFETYKKVSS